MGKGSACNAGGPGGGGSTPGSGRSPGEGQPASVFLPGESHGQSYIPGRLQFIGSQRVGPN